MKLKKIAVSLKEESQERGLYLFLIMYISNILALVRGRMYKILYWRYIKSTLFFIQSGTKIDIFNKQCRLIIKPFVFIRRNGTIRMDHGGELYIGEKTFINDYCSINCIKKITIGDYTKIGPNVSINDNDHNYREIGKERMLTDEITIGNHVWIGANSVILRGTHIGDYSVIGAGSVVKGDIPERSLFINHIDKKIISY